MGASIYNERFLSDRIITIGHGFKYDKPMPVLNNWSVDDK